MPRLAPLALILTLSAVPVALGLAEQVPPPPPPPVLPAAGQQPVPGGVRDPNQPQVRQVPVGTATISGAVFAADTGRPLARARVSVSGTANSVDAGRSAGPASPAGAGGRGGPVTVVNGVVMSGSVGVNRTVMTDTQGQFSFPKLPAGNYTVNVSRDQYLATTYGQKKPGRPGAIIPLTDGQQLTLKVPMLRGGVISGQVIGEDGEPLMNAYVRAMRYDTSSGFKRLYENRGATSDDRGMYRLFGLQPGEYLISVTPGNDASMSERAMIDAAAIESAVAAAKAQPTVPGQPPVISVQLAPPGDNPGPPAGFAPTFYPSATIAASATSLTIGAGEEKSGIDIPVQYVRASNIQGTILNPTPGVAVQVYIVADDPLMTGATSTPSARADPTGKFTLRNVQPGQYTIYAQTMQQPQFAMQVVNGTVVNVPQQQPQRLEDSQRLWGRVQVTVDGQSTPTVGIAMQPGKSLSGRVVFEAQVPPDLTKGRPIVTVSLAPSPQQVQFGPMPQAPIGPDGRFTIQGLGPGRYILRASGFSLTANAPIVQKSAVVNGEDTMDVPLDFTGDQDIAGATITMTDQLTELSGTLTDPGGKLGSEYTIIIAAADTRFWTPLSRRIQTTRPQPDGRYALRNLPPGDYMLAALTDLEPGSQYDPEFLKALATASVRVSLTTGEKRTQDLRVAK
ncbi:MAG TPA: carboxypeptidase-like regulatory domain-containing protein [Vicinamibacterales bacterium]|nr:carboxypeptidase-like regulatory domain-containing protein [Vicinamibacterales bacterium]